MALSTAALKVKITNEDGTSELRRLGFSFDSTQLDNSSAPQTAQQQQMKVEGYHLSLCKFLLRSLGDLYPDLPVGSFSELVVFSAKDEDGDMVRFDSEEEFVAAMTYNSWQSCLRVEVSVRKPDAVIRPSTNAPSAGEAVGDEPSPSAGGDGSFYGDSTARSDARSSMSFETDMSAASSSAASVASSSTTFSSASPQALPTPANPTQSEETGAAATMTADEGPVSEPAEVPPPPAAGVAASSAPTEAGSSINIKNNNNNNNNNNDAPAPSLSGSSSSAAPADVGDAATPAKAFLTQVLPGLADVLARSVYAAQWIPNGAPGKAPPASGAARSEHPPPAPTAEDVATAAARAAASSSARAVATVSERVQADAETPAVAAGMPGRGSQAPGSAEPVAVAVARVAAGAAAAAASASAAATAVAATAATAARTGVDTPEPAVHRGVQCDYCDVCPIVGTRYKCAVRSDFDLCEACESSAAGQSPFPFLKIRTPSQAPAAIVCLLKPDQPGTPQEAASAAAANKNKSKNPKTYAPGQGQGWRAGRSQPQQGGWGEGRRNAPRWMRDLARRQQQQADHAGTNIFPPGVEVLRGGSRPPWCGPRMQRRREEPLNNAAAAQKEADETAAAIAAVAAAQEAAAAAAEVATPPASAASSDAGEQAMCTSEADRPAEKAATEGEKDDTAKEIESAVEAPRQAAAPADQGTSPTEYHDLLAASMRSLASSMSASFTAPPEGGNGNPRGNNEVTGGAAKPQGKPMARFVTDVSVSDGSPLPPNTRFTKTWCLRNDGAVTFPPGCKMMPVGGDLMAGPEEGVAVEQRAPGEEFHVSVTLTTPPLSGRYIGYWRLQTAEGQKFGHRVWADVLVTGGTADLVTEGTMDGDWDLVNMQRLSKAVEDTGSTAAAGAPSISNNAAASAEKPGSASSAEGAISRSYAPGQAWSPPTKVDDAPAVEADGGFEESKSSDDGGEKESQEVVAKQQQQQQQQTQQREDVQEPAQAASASTSEAQNMAFKWHRELCSLAEMGFENTSRNVQLLEKHVVKSGNIGMERVLHELLSWREVSIQ